MAITLNGTTGITTTGLTSNGIDDNATSTAMTLDSSGRVGIGTSSPNSALETVGADGITISNSGDTYLQLKTTGSTATNYIEFKDSGGSAGSISYNHTNNYLATKVNGSERMRLDTSGNVLVGKTAQNSDNAGVELRAGGQTTATRSASWVGLFNRLTDNGDIVRFQKDSTTVGSIGTAGGTLTIDGGGTSSGIYFGENQLVPRDNGAGSNNVVDLGQSGNSFKDLYLSGGVYLGGTGAANKLDDYEEGTWTPAITSGGLSVSTNYSSTYTKVGSLVHVRTYFTVSGTGTSAIFNIGGLPFTSIGNGYSPNIIDIGKGGKAGAYCRVGTNTTELEVLYSGDSPTAPRVNMAGNQIANDGPYIILQATYHTNA